MVPLPAMSLGNIQFCISRKLVLQASLFVQVGGVTGREGSGHTPTRRKRLACENSRKCGTKERCRVGSITG